MKRSEVEPGGEYATADGTRIRVYEVDPGWAVENGRWVERPSIQRRYVNGAWVDFQGNFHIRAEMPHPVDEGRWVKVVVLPRNLLCTWAEYLDRRAVDEAEQRRASDAVDAFLAAFEERGLRIADVDATHQQVTVDVGDLARALGIDIKEMRES